MNGLQQTQKLSAERLNSICNRLFTNKKKGYMRQITFLAPHLTTQIYLTKSQAGVVQYFSGHEDFVELVAPNYSVQIAHTFYDQQFKIRRTSMRVFRVSMTRRNHQIVENERGEPLILTVHPYGVMVTR